VARHDHGAVVVVVGNDDVARHDHSVAARHRDVDRVAVALPIAASPRTNAGSGRTMSGVCTNGALLKPGPTNY